MASEKELEASNFPRLFKEREFKKALGVLDGLIQKYPSDPLLLRYRALTLDKLGRHPNHIPTHLFLGLAYARDGEPAEATRELQWVIEQELTSNAGLEVDVGADTTAAETATIATETGSTDVSATNEVTGGAEADVDGTGAGDDAECNEADGLLCPTTTTLKL